MRLDRKQPNKKQDEKDYYAGKILKDTGPGQDWMKETDRTSGG
jgi:hypothetical protein